MSRNGSGVYSLPAGSIVTDGTSIDASDHNTPLQDLETDMNTARPVVAGGTGATTASAARTNLGLGTIATQAASSVDIDGGAVDGTVIGANSAAAATVTDLTATGAMNFGGVDVLFDQVVIADDAVATITPPKDSGYLRVNRRSWPGQSGVIYYNSDSTPLARVHEGWSPAIGADLTVTTGTTLTGTTGVDGNTTIAINDGAIMIENRGGGSGTYEIEIV